MSTESGHLDENRLMHEKRALELLGMGRDFPQLEKVLQGEVAIEDILPSENLCLAYNNLNTTANPARPKIEIKQGVALELSSRSPEDPVRKVCSSKPLVYFGSDIDIEYPILLGGRSIYLVDPMLGVSECRDQLKEKIEAMIPDTVDSYSETQNQIQFKFDFGNGPEDVTVTLVPYAIDTSEVTSYEVEADGATQKIAGLEELPQAIGAAVFFVSYVKATAELADRMEKDGVWLDQDTLVTEVNSDAPKFTRLSQESPEKLEKLAREGLEERGRVSASTAPEERDLSGDPFDGLEGEPF